MNILSNRIRRPVERDGAAFYVFLTLLSFGLSVVFTRLFLQLTGYPQVGGKTLHIAHLLWGGLFLFIAALAMLVFANRWVYRLGAILSGLGVGLFIDEVGKFITRSNDYFYPPAAPIIYAFFLIVVPECQQGGDDHDRVDGEQGNPVFGGEGGVGHRDVRVLPVEEGKGCRVNHSCGLCQKIYTAAGNVR